ncbi:MAG: hypothetical protein AVDCRST_MAG62-1916, partial [uncultured Sphingomonas sp.]
DARRRNRLGRARGMRRHGRGGRSLRRPGQPRAGVLRRPLRADPGAHEHHEHPAGGPPGAARLPQGDGHDRHAAARDRAARARGRPPRPARAGRRGLRAGDRPRAPPRRRGRSAGGHPRAHRALGRGRQGLPPDHRGDRRDQRPPAEL